MAKEKSTNMVTADQVQQWKDKYGILKIIEYGELLAYFRKPDMRIWRFAIKAVEKSSAEFKKSLALNCFLGGSRQLLESPYLEDVTDLIDEFIEMPVAEIERDGNAYLVKVAGKSCRLKPINIEMQALAERNNPDDVPFKTQQNLLQMLWIEGDEDLRDEKNADCHMPLLKIVKDLREKHQLSIKNA